MLPLTLYIHIPWCIKKCPYCDFNSHAVKTELPEERYIDYLLNDLAQTIEHYAINRPLNSIFIGGGTPSLFKPESFERLLQGIATQIELKPNLEITLEANPGTFESNKFAEFRTLGINRLSIGIQSFNNTLLSRLGRVHNSNEAIRAVEIAQQSGFDNFNLDLMFGLPGATLEESHHDIATAIQLQPTHISYYQLTLEPNTYFHKFPPKLPNDELIFTSQQIAQELLTEYGYQQYEVSAYSRPDYQCQHNLNYWQFGDYLGIGAGAHGKVSISLPNSIIRTSKSKQPEQYLSSPSIHFQEHSIASKELPIEFIMNHLRLKEGFTPASYETTTGLNITTLEPALSNCLETGLLVYQNGYYRCSDNGWNFLDNILEKFIA